jgi:hypothetical protein
VRPFSVRVRSQILAVRSADALRSQILAVRFADALRSQILAVRFADALRCCWDRWRSPPSSH